MDEADRYAARVDAHLQGLSDDAARRAFLRQQHNFFETKFDEFQRKAAREELTDAKGGEAFIYRSCLCELETRLHKLEVAHG